MDFKRKLRFGILFILLSALLFVTTYAADVANKAVTTTDLGDRVMFTITLTFSATDSTDDLTSKAIDMYGFLTEGAVAEFVGDGETGRDVNLFIRGGNVTTLANIVSYKTRSELDDFSADAGNSSLLLDPAIFYESTEVLVSASADSAGVGIPDLALRCRYLVFEADGQTGNTVTTGTNSTIIYLILKKNPNIRLPNYEPATVTVSTI